LICFVRQQISRQGIEEARFDEKYPDRFSNECPQIGGNCVDLDEKQCAPIHYSDEIF